MRVIRIGHILDVTPLDETFARKPGFDLAVFWEKWRRSSEANRGVYPVQLRVAPDLIPYLSMIMGYSLAADGTPDEQGWTVLKLAFVSFAEARSTVLGFGCAAEVLEPQALRWSVIDFAQQIVGFYDRL